ncbi:MAG: amidohydrolase family protein [Pseudomonadales bacterium]|nr:amidohydrolase family protein [Pseudomonadales bacterium]
MTAIIEDQIRVNEKLYEHTQGYAIPVLGVNPWKIYHFQDYAHLVDATLARGVFKGVKLYPSVGYSVTGDIRRGITDRQCDSKGVSTSIIKEGMERLFEIVSSHDAYVTSHTTYSKGAEPGAEALAGARYWNEVLESRPDMRVNFGHMGDPGDNVGEEWRDGFLNLMNQYEHVHADFGYHEYASYDTLRSDLLRFKRSYGVSIFDKISYGSDWYMISKDKGANAYLCDSARSFERAVEEGVIDESQFKAMFYDNAHRFLRLS